MFGTDTGQSFVFVLDFSTNGDLAIGGQTQNPDFLAGLTTLNPYIAAIDNTSTFKFAKILYPSTNNLITAVKYSYNSKLIIGQLDTKTQYTIVFINSTDGSLVKVMRSSDTLLPKSINTLLLTDSIGNLWFSYTDNADIPVILGLSYTNLSTTSITPFMQSKWNDGIAKFYKIQIYKPPIGNQLIFFTYYQATLTPTKGGFAAIDSQNGTIKFGKWVNDVSITQDLDTFSSNYYQCGGLKAINISFFVGFTKVINVNNQINYYTATLDGVSVLTYHYTPLPEMTSLTNVNSFYSTYILDAFNSYYVGGTQKISNQASQFIYNQGFIMSNIQQNTCWSTIRSPVLFNEFFNIQYSISNFIILYYRVTNSSYLSAKLLVKFLFMHRWNVLGFSLNDNQSRGRSNSSFTISIIRNI
eukprot:403348503